MSHTPSERTSERNEAVQLTESARHRLLTAPERRTVLELLADRSGPVDLEELAESVATDERTGPGAASEVIDRVKTRLHHVHLPQLDDAGVVDYDADANRVETLLCPERVL